MYAVQRNPTGSAARPRRREHQRSADPRGSLGALGLPDFRSEALGRPGGGCCPVPHDMGLWGLRLPLLPGCTRA